MHPVDISSSSSSFTQLSAAGIQGLASEQPASLVGHPGDVDLLARFEHCARAVPLPPGLANRWVGLLRGLSASSHARGRAGLHAVLNDPRPDEELLDEHAAHGGGPSADADRNAMREALHALRGFHADHVVEVPVESSGARAEDAAAQAQAAQSSGQVPIAGTAPACGPTLASQYGVAEAPLIPRVLTAPLHTLQAPPPGERHPLSAREMNTFKAWAARIQPSMAKMQDQSQWNAHMAALENAMTQDEVLRRTCIEWMQDGLARCGDRALVMWQQIETAWLARKAETGGHTAPELLGIGQSMHRLAQVDAYAAQIASRKGSYAKEEAVECVLHVRETLRDPLALQLPAVGALYSRQARREVPELSDGNLATLVNEILASEYVDQGSALASALAEWPPMTQYLRRASPDLAALHQSIQAHRDQLAAVIEEHDTLSTAVRELKPGERPSSIGEEHGIDFELRDDGLLKWGARVLPPINANEYGARMEQCASQASQLGRAADLAAVKGFMEGGHRPTLEATLGMMFPVRLSSAALPVARVLHSALRQGELLPGWVHPKDGWNPLHAAAAAGDAPLIEALFSNGVGLGSPDARGLTPQHMAAVAGSASAIRALARGNAEFNVGDQLGYTPLHHAVNAGCQREVIDALVQAGAKVDVRQLTLGVTPLLVAAGAGDTLLVRVLLSAGANPLITARDGSTVLHSLRKSETARSRPDYDIAIQALRQAAAIHGPARRI